MQRHRLRIRTGAQWGLTRYKQKSGLSTSGPVNGVRELNTVLQSASEPCLGPEKPAVERFGWRFPSPGQGHPDRERLQEGSVQTADIGNHREESIPGRTGNSPSDSDDRLVTCDFGDLDEVSLRTPVTIHKSQGFGVPKRWSSRSPMQHYMLSSSENLIYTGICPPPKRLAWW